MSGFISLGEGARMLAGEDATSDEVEHWVALLEQESASLHLVKTSVGQKGTLPGGVSYLYSIEDCQVPKFAFDAWVLAKGIKLPASRFKQDVTPERVALLNAGSPHACEAVSADKPPGKPLPKHEADALRHCLSILAPLHEPHERRTMALNIEQRISGECTALLPFRFAQLAALFFPSDKVKACALAQKLEVAADSGRLVTTLPKHEKAALISDVAAWPDCPPISVESPLRYWLPHLATDEPARPALPPDIREKLKLGLIEGILEKEFQPMSRAPIPLGNRSNPINMAEKQREREEHFRKLEERRTALASLPFDEVQAISSAATKEEKRKRDLREQLEEAGRPFNYREAAADYSYWLRFDAWAVDESVALLLGKDPRRVTWAKVSPYVNISAFAKQYADLRMVALRANALHCGASATPPDAVIAWASQKGIALPPKLAEAVAQQKSRAQPTSHDANRQHAESTAQLQAESIERMAEELAAQALARQAEQAATGWYYLDEASSDINRQRGLHESFSESLLERMKAAVTEGLLEACDAVHKLPVPKGTTGCNKQMVRRESVNKWLGSTPAGYLWEGKQEAQAHTAPPERVPTPESPKLGAATQLDAEQDKQRAPDRGRRLKRSALIADNIRRWPTIERDLKDAAVNGLSDAARDVSRIGWWWEGSAREWSQARGKLLDAHPSTPVQNSVFHRIQD